MRNAGLKVIQNQCEAIRWKGMFIDADDDPTVPNSNTRSLPILKVNAILQCLPGNGPIHEAGIQHPVPEALCEKPPHHGLSGCHRPINSYGFGFCHEEVSAPL